MTTASLAEKNDLRRSVLVAFTLPTLVLGIMHGPEGQMQAIYAKQEPRKFERGTDRHTQANPLPMCHRPSLLVKVIAS